MTQKTVQLVGAVPHTVAQLAESDHGFTITQVADPERIMVTTSHLILHIDQDPDLDLAMDWIDESVEEGARVGLTSSGGLTQDVISLLFRRGIHVMRLLNDGNSAKADAIAEFLAADAYIERRKVDDLEIGQHFTWTADPLVYAAARQLSLVSATMEGVLKQLRDAVLAMQTPLPGKHQGQYWDPNGALTTSKKVNANPSLLDVFRLHDTPEAQRLLRPDGSDGWSAPKLLIRGESGSGKTLVARLVSELIARGLRTDRRHFPFVTLNCAALSGDHLEHQLFGAAPGMWSGIPGPVAGDLARASRGVAFLDEIGDMAMSAQRWLLVYLQDGTIRPTGIEPFPSLTRVIAATNRDVPLLIERQQFRNDLSARFDFQLEIPSLRERSIDERARLVDFAALNPQHNPNRRVERISHNALDALSRREYSVGNFRELETTVHTAIAKAMQRRSNCVRTKDLPDEARALTVLDSEAHIIGIREAPEGAMVDVKTESDLMRAANIMTAPILRTDDGSQYVLARGHVLRLRSKDLEDVAGE